MKKTLFPLVVLAFANSVFAQMNLTFDTSQLGNPGLNASNVYVTFAGYSSSMIFDPLGTNESINFAVKNITINGTSYGTSKAYSLADIQSKGLQINAAQSMVGYISYGSTTGISQLAQNVQPTAFSETAARWSNFEFTYSSGTGGSADLTNISQYGGSLKMEFRAGNTTQGYVQNKLNTGDTFRALAATSTNTTLSTISSGGNFVRVIGANSWPASVAAGGFFQTPYQTFEPYLQHLTATYGGNASSTLTNLAQGASPGGQGAYGYNSTANATEVAQNTSYNLDYHFGSFTTNGTGGNGSNLLLSGYVNATPTVGGGPTVVYGNLTISVAGDSVARGPATQASMTTFLYLESLSNAGVVVDFSGWETLNNDFGAANVNAAVQLKAAGDFAQGMLDGFVGSTVAVGNSTIGALTSADWFDNNLVGPTYTGSIAQPSNAYYSQWGNVVTLNSDGYNGGNFTSGMVYGSPYDDRFHVNLINADITTTEMKITLQPDGNLSLVVPEPTSAILLLGGLGFFFFLRKRALSKLA
ncbi:MAG: PEP-CTERM sorting domain-containing protein [Verrucomicrobiae bacterium]